MKSTYINLPMILTASLSLFISMSLQADDQVSSTTTTTTEKPVDGSTTQVEKITRQTVVTPVPAPKEVIATPAGYATCFTVDAGWVNNLWIAAHRVCQYTNAEQGAAWVEGYWGCNKATPEGVCSNWEWKPGRWEKNLVVY